MPLFVPFLKCVCVSFVFCLVPVEPELEGEPEPGSRSVRVDLNNLQCYWDDACETPAIKIEKLRVFDGEFVVVVGATGSGTSAFVNAILGELPVGNIDGDMLSFLPSATIL